MLGIYWFKMLRYIAFEGRPRRVSTVRLEQLGIDNIFIFLVFLENAEGEDGSVRVRTRVRVRYLCRANLADFHNG